MTTFIVALYVVRRLVLSPIVTRPAAQQQHRVSWVVGGWGGSGHYVVTPTQVEVELGCDKNGEINTKVSRTVWEGGPL